MENQTAEIITLCKTFANLADQLETKAFSNPNYQKNGFVEDFNHLFNTYCFGKQNRTVSGLNFSQPPRYHILKASRETKVESLSKTRCQVTFLTEPKIGSIRFILDKKQGEWKIIRFETYVGIAGPGKHQGSELWRKHKL